MWGLNFIEWTAEIIGNYRNVEILQAKIYQFYNESQYAFLCIVDKTFNSNGAKQAKSVQTRPNQTKLGQTRPSRANGAICHHMPPYGQRWSNGAKLGQTK